METEPTSHFDSVERGKEEPEEVGSTDKHEAAEAAGGLAAGETVKLRSTGTDGSKEDAALLSFVRGDKVRIYPARSGGPEDSWDYENEEEGKVTVSKFDETTGHRVERSVPSDAFYEWQTKKAAELAEGPKELPPATPNNEDTREPGHEFESDQIVTVKQNNGNLEDDWYVSGFFEHGGQKYVKVRKNVPTGEEGVEKGVLEEDLLSWQPKPPEAEPSDDDEDTSDEPDHRLGYDDDALVEKASKLGITADSIERAKNYCLPLETLIAAAEGDTFWINYLAQERINVKPPEPGAPEPSTTEASSPRSVIFDRISEEPSKLRLEIMRLGNLTDTTNPVWQRALAFPNFLYRKALGERRIARKMYWEHRNASTSGQKEYRGLLGRDRVLKAEFLAHVKEINSKAKESRRKLTKHFRHNIMGERQVRERRSIAHDILEVKTVHDKYRRSVT